MRLKAAAALVLAAGSVAASGAALAHGHPRVHLGFTFGAPVYWGPRYYAPYPRYYYAPAVVVPSSPPTYIEQTPAPGSAEDQNAWYFCSGANAYYPYVKDCPGGWQRVTPQPPPG